MYNYSKKGEKVYPNNYRGINLLNTNNKNYNAENYGENPTRRRTTRISKWAVMHRCPVKAFKGKDFGR
jgi:SLT domain-containing protein